MPGYSRPLVVALITVLGAAQPLLAQGQPAPVRRPGGMPTVSVPDFKNNVTGTWWWQGPVAQDLSHALANELASTGDLKVVERRNLGQVLSEQELAELGIVRKASPTAAKKGQMTGARYIVLGTVTSYDTATDVESKGSGMSFLGFGGRKQNTVTKDYVAIDIRIVDSTTGEVVGSRTVEGRATNTVEQKSSGGSLLPAAAIIGATVPMGNAGYAATAAAGTFSFSNNSTSASRTPAAKALRAALIEASGYVSCVLVPKGDCLAAYSAKDQQRRQNTLGTLQLE
jgi:curli biogenesis system outer membrane secretion channel CsgG